VQEWQADDATAHPTTDGTKAEEEEP